MLQTMKQRYKNNNNNNNNNRDFCSSSSYKQEEEKEEEDLLLRQDEMEVAEILLQLHHLISKYDTSPPLMSWGVKRKRSALDSNPSSPLPLIPSMSSIPSSLHQHHHHPVVSVVSVVFVDKREKREKREEREEEEEESIPIPKIESSSRRCSPATPLSFSPSGESDSISRKPYKRKLVVSTNKKKTKEEWQTDVIMLADQQDTLKKELRKVMDYYENLKAKNLELKVTLQKVKNHFHQKDLLVKFNSSSSSCNGKSLDLCLEQTKRPKLVLPSTVPPPPPEQVIEKPVPMVIFQQTNIIDHHHQQHKQQQQQQQQQQKKKKKFIRSAELLENSRYSYNQPIMPPPPPTSHLQSGVGTGFGGMGQNVSQRGLPDLNFSTDASSTTTTAAAAADETSGSSFSNGIEHPSFSNGIQHYQQHQQHWFESSNRAAAEARRRRMEEMRKGKKSMDSIKTRCR